MVAQIQAHAPNAHLLLHKGLSSLSLLTRRHELTKASIAVIAGRRADRAVLRGSDTVRMIQEDGRMEMLGEHEGCGRPLRQL